MRFVGGHGCELHLPIHGGILWISRMMAASQRRRACARRPLIDVDDFTVGRCGDDDICGRKTRSDDEKRLT